jgi:hypothetical protein
MKPRRIIGLVALVVSLAACGDEVSSSPPKASKDGCTCPGPQHPLACATGGSGLPSIPLGVYTECSTSVSQNTTTAGGAGGTVTLTNDGGVLTAELGKGGFAITSGKLSFMALDSSAAVIAPGQSYGIVQTGFSIGPWCTMSTVTVGFVVVTGDTLGISLIGSGCNQEISGSIVCTVPPKTTGTLAGPACDPAPTQPECGCSGDAEPPAFPLGVYSDCTPGLPGYGGGQVTLSQDEGRLKAAIDVTYVGDKVDLEFVATSEASANVVSNSTWVVQADPCSEGPGLPAPVPTKATVTSGSLVLDGKTLFVNVVGSDGCDGGIVASFLCTRP